MFNRMNGWGGGEMSGTMKRYNLHTARTLTEIIFERDTVFCVEINAVVYFLSIFCVFLEQRKARTILVLHSKKDVCRE